MKWTRRQLLKNSLVGVPALSLLNGCGAATNDDDIRLAGTVLGALDNAEGQHFVGGVSLSAGVSFRIPLPARGHSLARDPVRPMLVVVDRRPGRQFHVCNLSTHTLEQSVQAPTSRHFQGHAVFDASGRYLYATENVYDVTGEDMTPMESVVGVYDALSGYRREGELPAHGVGAHELAWMPDARTLAVAVGGVYTHPALERQALNTPTMAPALTLIDALSGQLLSRHTPADPFSSVRHLSVLASGHVVAAVQRHSTNPEVLPLLLRHEGNAELMAALGGNTADYRLLSGYTAGVVADPETGNLMVTSPRGNRLMVLDALGHQVALHHHPDISGTAWLDGHFVASAGTGHLLVLTPNGDLRAAHFTADAYWDNHLISVPD